MQTITNQTYESMVRSLAKQGTVILEELTGSRCNLWHMATGISGEAGELLDAVKKHVAYNKTLDVENIVEELGDLEFYMEGLRQELGITRQETLDGNYDKLMKKRYPQGYSDAAAHARADKA